MDVKYINPFVLATQSVFSTMLKCQLTRGKPSLAESLRPHYEIGGVIELSGKLSGTVVVSLDRAVATNATKTMLCQDEDVGHDDIIDAVGELTNMITGQAKSKLEEYAMSLSLPSVIVGDQQFDPSKDNVRAIRIPFDSDWGQISVAVALLDNS